jgi:hypothetical protein
VDGGGGNPQTPPVLLAATQEQKTQLARLGETARRLAGDLDHFERMFFPRPKGKTPDQSEKAAKLPDELKAILKVSPSGRNPGQLTRLENHWEKDAPEYARHLRQLRTAVEARTGFDRRLPRVMVMEDMKKPRPTYMLDKGLYDKRGEVVTAAVPAKLPPLPAGVPANRLALARWLVAPENPLTARVTVNRFWQQFFGIGLVKTPEDFGVQGEKPSHPELLDWLAAEFREGWDVKHLCRLIVTSEAYRQSAKVTPQLAERDPHNRFLARGARFRLPSWMLRDQALAASGLLVRHVGGPPVRPYQPAGVWEDATFGNRKYVQDKGDALFRRSLYTFWRRIIAPTEFFDTASRQTCWVKQTRTNSPLHALVTLNDPTFVESARALAQRVLLTAGPRQQDRVELAFRLVLARRPGSEETQVLLSALDRFRRELAQDPAGVQKLLRVGESRRNEALNPVEHAAYAALCSAILNLDEALTKE